MIYGTTLIIWGIGTAFFSRARPEDGWWSLLWPVTISAALIARHTR